MRDYIVEYEELSPTLSTVEGEEEMVEVLISSATLSDSTNDAQIIEVMEVGPQGAAGPSGVVILAADDPDPSPPLDGVLYLRLVQ